ncbi:MAG: 50S ribosomal protein L13 [Candidatus Paceibacterota bacterium]
MKKLQKTFMQRKEDVSRKWHVVDVEGKILGRISTEIAKKLIGKDKPTYTPHIDAGDFVVVINARKVALSRGKEEKKTYVWHTGFPGGVKERSFQEMINKHPERVILQAVKNMLPKNRLQGDRLARLKIYPGKEHKHESQLGGK